jgi:hypothetical protein
MFWRHDVTLRQNAKPVAFAAGKPIAARLDAGKGQVVVFAGTVLGESSHGAKPFWEGHAWKKLAKQMIAGEL